MTKIEVSPMHPDGEDMREILTYRGFTYHSLRFVEVKQPYYYFSTIVKILPGGHPNGSAYSIYVTDYTVNRDFEHFSRTDAPHQSVLRVEMWNDAEVLAPTLQDGDYYLLYNFRVAYWMKCLEGKFSQVQNMQKLTKEDAKQYYPLRRLIRNERRYSASSIANVINSKKAVDSHTVVGYVHDVQPRVLRQAVHLSCARCSTRIPAEVQVCEVCGSRRFRGDLKFVLTIRDETGTTLPVMYTSELTEQPTTVEILGSLTDVRDGKLRENVGVLIGEFTSSLRCFTIESWGPAEARSFALADVEEL